MTLEGITSTISIAMCTYNGEKFLSEQLASILRQSYLPDELVICDDKSQDGTTSIIEEFAAKAPFPVRLYKNEVNLGYKKNFEKAACLCREILSFLQIRMMSGYHINFPG